MTVTRKWLLRTTPFRLPLKGVREDEFWVSISPEVKFSKTDEGCYITIADDIFAIDEALYDRVNSFSSNEELHTIHTTYINSNIEVFVVLNVPLAVYAVATFTNQTEANQFQFPWPDLILEEVTGNSKHDKKNIWNALQ